jgi:hypothetical protein
MSKTERKQYAAILESKEVELAGRLGNRDGIEIEKAADPLDEVHRPESESLRYAVCTVNRICCGRYAAL